jgi:GNAT superfamily N-acetyltransferase
MHLRPAENRDIPTLVDISQQWYNGNNELSDFLRPHRGRYPATVRQQLILNIRTRLLDPLCITLVAETDPEDYDSPSAKGIANGPNDWKGEPRVTGAATWERKGESAEAKAWMRTMGAGQRIDGVLSQAQKAYFSNRVFARQTTLAPKLAEVMAAVTAADEYFAPFPERWYLASLEVDERFARRGIGSLLVRWGMERAKGERVPVSLFATVAGERVYRKLGFEALGDFKAGPGVGGVVVVQKVMAWFPEGFEGGRGVREESEERGEDGR